MFIDFVRCPFLIVWLLLQLCSVKSTLEEMEFILSSESHLTEQLLPSKYSFFIRESRYLQVYLDLLMVMLLIIKKYQGVCVSSVVATLLVNDTSFLGRIISFSCSCNQNLKSQMMFFLT